MFSSACFLQWCLALIPISTYGNPTKQQDQNYQKNSPAKPVLLLGAQVARVMHNARDVFLHRWFQIVA